MAPGDTSARLHQREHHYEGRSESPSEVELSAGHRAAAESPGEARFAFGENWRRFLAVVDDERIRSAERSLAELIQTDLAGKSFLDVGSGSGLASLAAVRLGASRVRSFDYDGESVACTQELKRRFAPDSRAWSIDRGDVLDRAYLEDLGTFDVVYAWGVLHHTGRLWDAVENASMLVAPGGLLVLALYRDQGVESRFWLGVKRVYNSSAIGRAAVSTIFVPLFFVKGVVVDLLRRRNPATRYRTYESRRGMSLYRDWIDWLGGLPFEVATAAEVVDFSRRHDLETVRVIEGVGSNRNHEYVFVRGVRADQLEET
jgi:SAM-dependent methyltransferase